MPAHKKLEYGEWDLVKTDPVLQGVIKGVLTAGRMLRKNQSTPGLLNAEADRASSERLIASAIRRSRPQDSVFGKSIPITGDHTTGTVWLINGIDGIVNYGARIGSSDVAVAQIENGLPVRSVVYDFKGREMFYAARGEGSFVNGKRMHISEVDAWKNAWFCFILDYPIQSITRCFSALGSWRESKPYRQKSIHCGLSGDYGRNT